MPVILFFFNLKSKNNHITFKCSSKIFVPSRMSITPPVISAGFEYREPKKFPMATPPKLKMKVVTPIINMEIQMFTCRKANDTPTAKASMLVATASRNIVFKHVVESGSSDPSSDKASRIMLAPINKRSPKAIQWSIATIRCSNCAPKNSR